MNKRRIRECLQSNRGAGLATVIIAGAFVAILGSILLSVSFTNFSMKQTNLQTKDTFYSAEQALDEINVGLQTLISEAISEAYLEVMENYASYDVDKKKDLMESVFFSTIWTSLEETGSLHTKYNLAEITALLSTSTWTGNFDTGYGAIVTSDTRSMVSYTDSGVVLKDLKIYYRDQKGYVSIIYTDIRLVLPDLSFATSTVLPNIAAYGLIADEGLITGTTGTNQLSGEIYAGSLLAVGSDSIIPVNLNVVNNTSFIIKNNLYLENCTFTTSDTTAVWTNDISVTHATANLYGITNVSDDTNMLGDGSKVTIQNIYNGYGNSLDQANKSSAILINGANSVLDLSNANVVTLAGHAYVGTKKVNLGSTTGTTTGNGSDIYTGESISVKSSQLMYLVPAECIGVSEATGKSMFNKNPLTATEYAAIIASPTTYSEISDTVNVASLNSSLGKYLKHDGVTLKPQAEKVFATSQAETYVYYYMTFKSEDMANQYFRDYFALNETKIENYMDFYSNGITIQDPRYMLRLQLAGNVLKYDEATADAVLQQNTLTNASVKLDSTSQQYTKMNDALCTKLVTNYAELTGVYRTDLENNIVFDNIVNEASLKNFIALHSNGVAGGVLAAYTFSNTLNTVQAILVDNPTPFTYTASMSAANIIIATGDVNVNANFNGIIISNGKVTVANGVSVTANSAVVKEALRLQDVVDGSVYSVIGFLWDGTDLLSVAGDSQDADHTSVQLADLVVYENWRKE